MLTLSHRHLAILTAVTVGTMGIMVLTEAEAATTPPPKTVPPSKTGAPKVTPQSDLEIAKKAINDGDLASADRLLKQIVGKASLPARLRADAMLLLTHLDVATRDNAKAEANFRKTVELAKVDGARAVVALCQKAIFELGWEVRMPTVADLAVSIGLDFAAQLENEAQRKRVMAQFDERAGVFAWNAGYRVAAVQRWTEALKNATSAQSLPSQFWATHHLAVASAILGQGTEMENGFKQARAALQIAVESGDLRLAARARYLLGEFAAPVPEDALAQLDSALKLVRGNPVPDKILEAQILVAQATAHRRQNQVQEAQKLTIAAIKLAPDTPFSIREEIRKEAELTGLGKPVLSLEANFEEANSALLPAVALGDTRTDADLSEDWLKRSPATLLEALENNQRGKMARLLVAEGLEITNGLSTSKVKSERNAAARLWLLKRGVVADSKATSRSKLAKIRQAQIDLDTLRASLYSRHPRLKSQRALEAFSTLNLEKSLDGDTAILKFGRLFNANGSTKWFSIGISMSEAGILDIRTYALGNSWTSSLFRWSSAIIQNTAEANNSAREAFAILIKPALPQISGKKRLVLSPDGALWNLPFGTLLNENGLSMNQTFEMVLSISASTMPSVAEAPHSMVIVTNPDPGGEARRLARFQWSHGVRMANGPPITADGRGLTANGRALVADGRNVGNGSPDGDQTPLLEDEVARENATAVETARQVMALVGLSTILAGQDATTANFLTAIAGADAPAIAQLDVTALLQPNAPLRSALLLAEAPGNDGFLTLTALASTRLPSTVVLNWQTESDVPQEGLEILPALSFAMSVAGTKSLVVPFWNAREAGSPAFWKEFYTRKMQGDSVVLALKNAAQSTGQTPRQAARFQEVLCGY